MTKRSLSILSLQSMLACVLFLAGCNLPAATTTTDSGIQEDISYGELQVRFLNVTDGGLIEAVMAQSETDAMTRPLVVIQFEVTGGLPMSISMTANGYNALDESNHPSVVDNLAGATPFTGELHWSPMNGGGEYTLVFTIIDANKNSFTTTIHVTVTGVTAFTPTPPPLDQADAARRISEIIQEQYAVDIPQPSLQRFDFPYLPNRSVWIGAAYAQGQRYYVELYDDGHYELSPGSYSDPAHKRPETYYIYCKPEGQYRILILYVDYGNVPGIDPETFLAETPVMIAWLNQVYTNFAVSQGYTSAPMQVEGESAFVSAPPTPGNLLLADEIRSLTGVDPSDYDFILEIDLDANNTYANQHWPGVFPEVGGGIALQGCGSFENPQDVVNIWSALSDPAELQGALFMDLSHEMSHLFGMMDDWPFGQATLTLPDGSAVDDWIPYVMFGWTDSDGDGIIEILDPTPYGTNIP